MGKWTLGFMKFVSLSKQCDDLALLLDFASMKFWSLLMLKMPSL